MRNFFVYIDDSGSPGQVPANKFLAKDTKIWAAVILSSREKKYINKKIKIAKRKFCKKFQFSEFHFTEIYSGKKDFKEVDSDLRLEMFEFFVELYNSIKPVVFVNSAGIDTLKNSGFSDLYINTKMNGFDFSKPSDYALNNLLLIINQYFVKNYKDDDIKVEIIIDEGRQKANTVQRVTDFLWYCKELNYKSSKEVYGLQFVDFIAFYINRTQNNYSKDRTKFDDKFMSIVGKLQLNSNIKMINVSDLDMLNKDLVESSLANQEKANSESIQYIEELSERILKIKDCILKKSLDFDKKYILDDIRRLKQVHSNAISDEFNFFLDQVEHKLSNKR